MTRPATPRPPGEHLALLARVIRQVSCNRGYSPTVRKKIVTSLSVAMNELQKVMAKQ